MTVTESGAPKDALIPGAGPRPGAERVPRTAGATAIVPGADTLTGILRHRAQQTPDEIAFVFLTGGEEPGDTLTYRELDQAARSTAAMLRSAGTGDSAVLLYPAGLEFVRTLLGCMYARVAGAPVQVPNRERGLERLRKIADDAGTTVVLTTTEVRDDLLGRFRDSRHLAGLTLVATDTLGQQPPEAWQGPEPQPGDIALLQYTSGSTGDPKGVMVTQANFLANCLDLDRLWPVTAEGRFVSWLPHFHDMGMLFGVVMPLWAGVPACLMAPEAFIRRPGRWLEAISRFRGTHSAAPSFAYELCVRDAEQNGIAGFVDLAHWRVAVNGAEPVRWNAVRDFTRTFAPAGFRPETMCPGYGLAENTLKATGSPEQRRPALLWVSADALRDGRVEPLEPHEGDAVPLVGSGITVGDTVVRVVATDTLRPCPAGTIGEIWIGGPSVALGYRGREADTEEVFRARIPGHEDEGTFLRTGDLGFQYGDEFYIAGRLKDIIIRKGRNFYPQDIELAVESTTEGLRPNCSAAFSVDDGSSERLVIVVEADGRVLREVTTEELKERIREAVYEGQRLHTDEVVVVRRGSLSKTSSGKIQRRLTRQQYLDDALSLAATEGARR
ncbi:fatty acyl-AMP ligase [Streptomyces aidingensis]|uniref:Acyl-CoA synthetase (AMP-forming)/AMP-acid ligase II n=1 Tax=Streptomyces aidingensis TaxID=910347 RepID=A0A1I1FGF2_9ACTN|nr:fatty acyl-AMP ligase [Streptomyces aidingensis]SFB98374.1 Acyl-CoA synthetase (AMP-forming)/AMP-acid ligase II [Streptomyces aidingensis]